MHIQLIEFPNDNLKFHILLMSEVGQQLESLIYIFHNVFEVPNALPPK